jgi:hypothetical protein
MHFTAFQALEIISVVDFQQYISKECLKLAHMPLDIGCEGHAASGFCHAKTLCNSRRGIDEIVEARIAGNQIELRVREGHCRTSPSTIVTLGRP